MTFEEKLKKANAYLWNEYGEALFEDVKTSFIDYHLNDARTVIWVKINTPSSVFKDAVYIDKEDACITIDTDLLNTEVIKAHNLCICCDAKLPKLKTIDADNVRINTYMPNLKTIVSENVEIGDDVSLPNLETIYGRASIFKRAKLPRLETINGNAWILDDADVSSLRTISENAMISEGANVPSLEAIGGYAEIREGVNAPEMIPNPNGKGYIRKDLLDNNQNEK